MVSTPQPGYTCSEAAHTAMRRLGYGVERGTPEYEARHGYYLKTFYHYLSIFMACKSPNTWNVNFITVEIIL